MFLRELRAPVSDIPGCGAGTQEKLARLGIRHACDLLLFRPRTYEDRSQLRKIKDFARGIVQCAVTVVAHDRFFAGGKPTLKVWVEDDEGTKGALVCFNRLFLERTLPVGAQVKLCGEFEYKYGELQCTRFEMKNTNGKPVTPEGILAIYPMTDGLTQSKVRGLIAKALVRWGNVDDELPASVMRERNLLKKADALKLLHLPRVMEDVTTALRSLAYEELFYVYIVIAKRVSARKTYGESMPRDTERAAVKLAALEASLPFALSADQRTVIAEIQTDIDKSEAMARLLQGDVGSGKTLVAFFAMLYAVTSRKCQAVLLAPTELLARQHADNAAKLLEPLGVRLAFLSGNVADTARKSLLTALAAGDVDIIIGTHALFSKDVVYKNLRLIVIDEQQRFGVLQRIAMNEKGNNADMLMMTATPIPRTLLLTAFGDLSVSVIRTMPQDRLPVITHLAKDASKVYDFVRNELAKGHKAYFVYPLIGPSEQSELKNAVAMFEYLSRDVFPNFTGALIHARLAEDEKREIMRRFTHGCVSFLAATSVLEVGVDVPEATCMIVEHAERFGLATLHQFRGRVGRSSLQSYCFLVWTDAVSDDAKERLLTMKNFSDGFIIAEKDLLIRGPGELAGIHQAGALNLLFVDLSDELLLCTARSDAERMVHNDPQLISIEGNLIRIVLDTVSPFSELTTAQ